MRIAVLGGGNGSFAGAGDFALQGHEVRLWRRDADGCTLLPPPDALPPFLGKQALARVLRGPVIEEESTRVYLEDDGPAGLPPVRDMSLRRNNK